MASDLGSLAYCYELPVNGEGAQIAENDYLLLVWCLRERRKILPRFTQSQPSETMEAMKHLFTQRQPLKCFWSPEISMLNPEACVPKP